MRIGWHFVVLTLVRLKLCSRQIKGMLLATLPLGSTNPSGLWQPGYVDEQGNVNAEANRTIRSMISTECWGSLYYSFLSYYLSVSAFKTKSCLSLDSGRLKQRCWIVLEVASGRDY